MTSGFLRKCSLSLVLLGALTCSFAVRAAEEAPDAWINRLSGDVLGEIKSDKSIRSGDMSHIIALVDTRILPYVDFSRMTASAVGPGWRQATPEQQKQLQDEFKTLLVRTYAGALLEINDKQTIAVKPVRANPEDKEVLVRTEVKGGSSPIQLDYRLEKDTAQAAGWKIFNLNVMGVWLVDTYRTQFAGEIRAKGIDGLIASLRERNKTNTAKKN